MTKELDRLKELESMPRIFRAKRVVKYRKFIASPEWKDKKGSYIKKNKHNLCQVCGLSKFLVLHHRSYQRVGNESKKDLVLVCGDCHSLIHFNNGVKTRLQYRSLTMREVELRKMFASKNKNPRLNFYNSGVSILKCR